ncbi:sec1 family domain-containing protein MIP3 [Cucumis melo]|uniref:Sec1 family domain-containing protein MIP3 n=1 Tax=Cucumis melo TaxID=3656 RepID=A0ABM3KDA0_CUCME|nr:sec1 family domain-containing protein MIP3 [Cucumis melo]XP_050935739.1 sec1 family domain-containing protein MIP3 [Cucumis melo]
MALLDVTRSCLDSISQIADHLKGSILYLDAGCVESFQILGGFPLLLDHGVNVVCSLENMASLDAVIDWNPASATKLVVITSRLLSDAHRYILRCLTTHQGVRHCTIFTSISELAHSAYPDSPLGPDAFHEYESLLVQDYEELVKKDEKKALPSEDRNLEKYISSEDEGWSRLTSSEEDITQLEASSSGRESYEDILTNHQEDVGQKLVVSVHHFPMILCPFSPRVFVLPSEGLIAEACLSAESVDSLSPGLPPLYTGMPPDGDDIPPGATLTAHFLYHFAAKMDLKMEIFSIGDLSKTVGKMLTDMSSLYDVGRRKKSAGLLLVDRTLDLLTPCCHGDSLVDRMFLSLPRRKRTSPVTHVKSPETSLKKGPRICRRAPVDVRIPFAEILTEDGGKADKFRLGERIEAFLSGWNSGNSISQNFNKSGESNRDQALQSPIYDPELLSGCFVSSENFRGTPYMEAILDRKTKDGTVLIKKWLQETMRKENVVVNGKIRPGFPTKLELESMIKALARSQTCLLKNKGVLQLAAAATVAIEELNTTRWDAFLSAEKILRASAEDTSQGLAAQIVDLINKSVLVVKSESSKGILSFEDALLLTITGYILAGENFPTSGSDGPFSWQEEHFIKEAIIDAILENPVGGKLKFLHGLIEELQTNRDRIKSKGTKGMGSSQIKDDDFDDQWDSWGDDDADINTTNEEVYDDMQLKLELRDRVDSLFKTLHKLSGTKKINLLLKETLNSENILNGDQYANKGVLYKLLARILNKHDLPNLEYHSSTMGRLFKSGFGRFGLGQAKPSLADQNVILVFVIGGVNGLEVREAQEALSESGRPDIELIVGGTTFLTPDDMFDLLLGDSAYV